MIPQTVNFQLKGADELIAALRELPMISETKVMRRGLSRGGARLRTYMRRNARRISGELVKSIGIRRIKSRKPMYVVGLIRNAYYKTLDAGRKPYQRTSSKGNKFNVAGTDRFKSLGTGIERTWNTHKEEIAQMIIDEAKAEFAREAGRLFIKRGGR